MQDDKDKTLLGEEKDPFASIIDEAVDPFEKKETDPFETPLYKQDKVEKPKKIKPTRPQEDNNDFFNPISTKAEDQIYEKERSLFKSYRILGTVITVALFTMFIIAYLFSLLFQWMFGFH
jgi:hypothetical protein